MLKVAVTILTLLLRDIVRYCQRLYLRAAYRVRGINIAASAHIICDSFGRFELGKGSYIGDGVRVVVTTEGANEKVASFFMGENSVINEYSNVRASGGNIVVGSNTMIAQGVSLIATNHEIDTDELMIEAAWNQAKAEITIGDNVWIGAHSVILPGVVISSGAVIAAGSVVTKSIGKNEVWAGVPARFIRHRRCGANG